MTGQEKCAQGFIVAIGQKDYRAKIWAEAYLTKKFRVQPETIYCTLTREELLAAISELRGKTCKLELLTYLYPIGHESVELLDFIREEYKDIRINYMPFS